MRAVLAEHSFAVLSVLVGGALDMDMEHIGSSPPRDGRDVTHLLIVMDYFALGGRDRAAARMDRLVAAVRQARPVAPVQPVMVSGDPQRAHAERQRRAGLEVDTGTAPLLDRLAASLVTPDGVA